MAADQMALRVSVLGAVQATGFRAQTRRRAEQLGVLGWVRSCGDGGLVAHLEGAPAAVEELLGFLRAGPERAEVSAVEVAEAKVEGHEQFRVRGVPSGRFLVLEGAGGRAGFELRLELEGVARRWSVPKGPSMRPADRRFALEIGELEWADPGEDDPAAKVWDQGHYEQGGRVPWPEAIERGHAVFVLHGGRLEGGFALQRTASGSRPRWLLIKRRER